ILQAVSFEYRKKPNNFLGAKTYEIFLLINGLLATVLIGTAVSTFFTGSMFSVDDFNLSKWEVSSLGLEAALNIQNLSLGLGVFFLARILGALHFFNSIDHDTIQERSRKQVIVNTILFLVFFLLFVFLLLTKEGFAVNPDTKEVFMQDYKYLQNFLDMPIVMIMFLIGVVLVLYGIFAAAFKKNRNGFWFASPGSILVALSLFLIAGFNNTAYYPSTFDLQSSLTIENSSSSHYTLTAMSYVSLTVPFVIAYIWYAWRSINKKKLDMDEINSSKENGDHVY
ncbi:MAG: cytochrome C oxidase assembly protein, partial [Marinilabiliales bacterium]